MKITLREKCPNTELSLVRIFLQSVRIRETPYLDPFHAVSFIVRNLSKIEIEINENLNANQNNSEDYQQ